MGNISRFGNFSQTGKILLNRKKVLSLSSTAKSVDVINSPFGVRASDFVVESTIGKSASKSTILAYFQPKETQLNLGASERRIASRYAVK